MTIASSTGIGSLPHHHIDTALEYSFRFDVPFLPQIPLRNPWELMLPQALEGLPGLELTAEGMPIINTDIWLARTRAFEARLNQGLESPSLGESFAPSSAVSSSWQSFVWELEERNHRGSAKVQIAGPLTTQWSLRAKDGAPLQRHPELYSQIVKLILLRAQAMVRRLRDIGVTPLIFIDEPGIFALDAQRPEHLPMIQELKLLIRSLSEEGARIGLHCCSNAQWETLLQLPIDYLSFDYDLSFSNLVQSAAIREQLQNFLKRGGRLSVGIVPTARSSVLQSLNGEELLARFLREMTEALPAWDARERFRLLGEFLYTPACGLAFHSIPDAELIFGHLRRFTQALRQRISEGTA